MAHIVLINPRFNPSYWGMNYALPFLGGEALLPVINLPLLAGRQEADLTTVAGTPIRCDGAVLTFPDNGHILIQVAEKGAGLTPLGFAGDGLDYEMNPNFVTLPLSRIYMPHLGKPARPQIFEGIHGNCFLGWELNIRNLSAVTCSATIDLGPQELIYFVNIRIKGAGRRVP